VELEETALFRGIDPAALSRIRQISRVRNYLGNETIFREGEPATDFYILRDGKVLLTFTLPRDPTTEFRIATIGPGETFAWAALAREETLSSQARALDDSSVYIVPARELHTILLEHPAAGYEVMTRLADRILSRLRQTRVELRWLYQGAR